MTERQRLIEAAIQAWKPGAQISAIQPLRGGMSAELWKVTGGDFAVVARFPGSGLMSVAEDAAGYEFQTLRAVRGAGLRAPEPHLIYREFDEALLLLQFLEGEATANPVDPQAYLTEYARALAEIHQVDASAPDFAFLLPTRRQFASTRSVWNEELREPEIVERLIAAGPQNEGPDVLRHGDFWPGNILWQGGCITGIIDWENALRGPAIADLAISRLDVCWILGPEAMEKFTRLYLEFNPIDVGALAYWDLRAALRPMANLDEWAEPYAALGRADISPLNLRLALEEFIAQSMDSR